MAEIDINTIIAFSFAVLLLYLAARMLLAPARFFMRLVANSLLGALLLVLFNLFGSYWGLSLGINIITAAVVGFLGVPGMVMLLLIQRMVG